MVLGCSHPGSGKRVRPRLASMAAEMDAPWPYPFWIAHRGAGRLAPENTLAAMHVGLSRGWRMAECDLTLSADGVPFLLHDERLERTTSGRGIAVEQPWSLLATLDAGAWHSPRYAGETLPRLEALAALSMADGLALNIELKPGPGDDVRCGRVGAGAVARLWATAALPPLISSFSTESLAAARQAAPILPRALLLSSLAPDWRETAEALGVVAVVISHKVLDANVIDLAHDAGLRVLSYTVNTDHDAERLIDAGIDGLITDAIDHFDPRA